jgi:Zn-dependent protease
MGFDPEWILERLLLLPPLLFSLVIHEYAHARTALAFGDPTARNAGRVTFNPLAHLDPIGTLCIFVSGFGWARPVPVDPQRLYPQPLADILVSLAGPLSNLFLAAVTGGLLKLWTWGGAHFSTAVQDFVGLYLLYLIIVNVALCAFNLIPLFPLDGHHIVRDLLPVDRAVRYMQWQVRFGMPLLLALVFGPRLLTIVTQGRLRFDPLDWFFSHAEAAVLRILGG